MIQKNKEKRVQELKNIIRKKNVIINSTHDGLISVDDKGRIELFNDAAEKMFALDRKEVLNKKVEEVIPNTRLHLVLENGEAELNQIQNTNETTIITNRVPVKDKEENIIGAVAVFRDITEVKNLAEEITNLREIRSMLEAIINSTQDAISVVDENGVGILINPAYTRLTGFTEEDIIGKPANVDIAEGQSMHYKVLETKEPVKGVRMKVGPNKKDVIVDAAPIIVDDELKGSVAVAHDVSEIKKLTEELNQAKQIIRQINAKYSFQDIVGESENMQAVINQAEKASKTPITVLLRGESGTGKELFAHAIHNNSERSQQKFVRVNCSALADNILESELFGYTEGAFTGAKKGGKKGLFEEADQGTIFLDEIGKISMNLQSKLLRVIQEKEILRVGGTRPIDIDVRIIVATNINLEKAIQDGNFREDLYYRLNVFPIFIPPLRERKEDIPFLIHHIITKFNQEYGRSVKGCSKEAISYLKEYDWPGNVRELENIIGRAMINLALNEDIIEIEHIPDIIEGPEEKDTITKSNQQYSLNNNTLKDIINKTEKQVIKKALKETSGNRKEAAEILGIAVRSLYYKINKYEIE
ncbi:MAG TPA: sigma-54-dependent Fis family transcriptional regulator [Halanaerobiales bacterium]|nr:sigma-54-dependent Fis family transcriptional regulator [Halanaerobiales bacterium]